MILGSNSLPIQCVGKKISVTWKSASSPFPETIENYDFAETDCTATTSIVPQILGGQQYFTAESVLVGVTSRGVIDRSFLG